MQWPSDRVAQGGIFQPAKVNYTPATTEFLRTLINESKLTTMQRDKVQYCLRTGEPLPSLSGGGAGKKQRSRRPQIRIRPGSSKRRSLTTIAQSGCYERDVFRPDRPLDRDAAKRALQHKMEHGNEVKPEIAKPAPKKIETREKPLSRFDQLKMEIQERQDWLKEMEELGEGDKHRLYINQQIQAKIRDMKRLEIVEGSPRKT